MTLCKTLCLLLQIGIFAAFWETMQTNIKVYAQTSILLFLIYSLVLIWLHQTYGSLRVGSTKIINLFTGQLLSLLLSDSLLFLLCTLSIRSLPSIPPFLMVIVLQLAASMLWCWLANKLYFAITPNQKAAIIYYRDDDLQHILEVCNPSNHYDVISTIDVHSLFSSIDDLLEQLHDAQTVFLGTVPGYVQDRIIRHCADHHQSVIIRPNISTMMVNASRRRFLSHTPTLDISLYEPSVFHGFCKRMMDIAFSALLLLIASPIMGVVALLIKLDDKGPALFRQKRLTKDGKVFEILKFRSMRVDAEKDGIARLATQNDDRITRIGKFIRATRLDELPQLWNILKGDMSLVGPRPERPEIAEQYLHELPEFNTRLRVKAGLTGYAQVHGKYNSTPQDKLLMDLMYISQQSIAQDVKLILQTIQIMLKKESTEGVAEGQSTALSNKKTSA